MRNIKAYTIESVATIPVIWEIETKLNKKELTKAIYDGIAMSDIDPHFEVFTTGHLNEACLDCVVSLSGKAQRFIRRLIRRVG
jgi:hypothetical protein